jgi:hypothetical protein
MTFVRDRMSLRKTDLIQATQLRRRPSSYANTLPTVLLRTYSPALRNARQSEMLVIQEEKEVA